ncbi:hypothetical protein [Bacillus pseudomycoides]|uniref:hypothetical protein n=1 Tax=Bacillus pseudomycoides TaxID=64104 RepID=UPI00211D5F39|nr:hypothetical protein [Bacillus pseudomycoides]
MQLEQQDLFKGERVVMERKANAMIDFEEFGIKKSNIALLENRKRLAESYM